MLHSGIPDQPSISILIGSRNRPQVLRRCLESIARQQYRNFEVIVLDDASSPPVNQDELRASFPNTNPIRFLRNDHQLGLAKVRNRLIAEAAGDVYCIVDDDAYFDNEAALQHLATALVSSDNAGIIAFNILDYRQDGVRSLTPHKRRHIKQDASLLNRPHLVSYFLGCGHAIRRTVIATCGGFDEVLVYGVDEIELAYRALDNGFQIQYQPDILLHHDPPVSDKELRSEKAWRLHFLLRNRILFAHKHLPIRYYLPYVIGWLGFYGMKSLIKGIPVSFLKGISGGLKDIKLIHRSPIKPSTVTYLKAHFGRLWY